jgi:transcriptional regulator with XRE-family HTH domain
MEVRLTMETPMQRAMSWNKAVLLAGIVCPLTVFGLRVGTGGELTEQYYKQRGERGYAYVRYEGLPNNSKILSVRAPAEDLAQIRSVFKTTVTELATLCGVSRQAVYDWQAGKAMAPENAAKLAELAKAADLFVGEGLTSTSRLLRRPIKAGKTLFDVVREGGSAEEAAASLARVLHREIEEQQLVAARLAGRRPIRNDSDDYGAPMLDEGTLRPKHG